MTNCTACGHHISHDCDRGECRTEGEWKVDSVVRAASDTGASRDALDAIRWRAIDKLASDPGFELNIDAGGWVLLKSAIDRASLAGTQGDGA